MTSATQSVSFLIVGTPRSGTTLVQRLACELPGVSMPPETHFFRLLGQDLAQRSFPISHDDIRALLKRFFADEVFGDLKLDSEHVSQQFEAGCLSVWALFEAVVKYLCPDGEILGEKTPSHLYWCESLSRIAPDLKIIGVVRDPRAAVASNIAAPWGLTLPLLLAERWRYDQEVMVAIKNKLPDDNRLILRYEDVVADPDGCRKSIAQLLGVTELETRSVAPTSIVLPQEQHKRRALEPVTTSRVEAWRESLSQRRGEQIVAICRRGMDALGYSPPGRWHSFVTLVLASPVDHVRRLRYRSGLSRRLAPIGRTRLDDSRAVLPVDSSPEGRVNANRLAGMRVAMSPLPTAQGNPYIWKLCDQLKEQGATLCSVDFRAARYADLLHYHWPDHLVSRASRVSAMRGAVKALIIMVAFRVRRRPVVWTVHNLKSHDTKYPVVEKLFWALFTRLVTGFISLSRAGASLATERYPALARKAVEIVPHGLYDDVYPPFDGSIGDAREQLGLPRDAFALLFFGQLRRYKAVEVLIRAFRNVEIEPSRLIVAGDGSDEAYKKELAEAAAASSAVDLRFGRVSDADVARYFKASVGLVLPFGDVLNSGSIFLALTMGRPVLVPYSRVFDELSETVGPQWLQTYRGELTATQVEQFLGVAHQLVESATKPDLKAFDWRRIGRLTADFYLRLRAR